MSNVKEMNGQELSKHLENTNKLTLVKFGANWCGPCKTIAPILDELSRQYEDQVDIISVDIDKGQEVASNFGVRGIPAMFFLKDGKIIDSLVGLQDQVTLGSKLEEYSS